MTTATAPAKSRRGIKLKDGDTVTQFPGQLESSHLLRTVSIDAIVVDPRLQFRADGLDPAYVADLAQVYSDNSGEIPPITLYESVGVLTLADGFHRHAAMVAAGLSETRAIVHQGNRQAAMRCALQANGQHGRRRTLADAVYAYRHAIAESLVEPGDVKAVASLLGVSDRWAREITREARDRANAERDATIQRLAQEGKTQRQIQVETGVPQKTVSRVLESKRKSSEMTQAKPVPALPITDGQREGVYLLFDAGLSIPETAQDLGIPESVVAALAKSRPKAPTDPDPSAFVMTPSAPDPQQPAPAEDHPLRAAKAAYLRLSSADRSEFREWLYGESHG
jgi:hypothetical protein